MFLQNYVRGILFCGLIIFIVFDFGNCAEDVQNALPTSCGKSSAENEFPWIGVVKYVIDYYKVPKYLCYVSLINERYVLTEAFCMVPGPKRKLGKIYFGGTQDCAPGTCKTQSFEIVEIIIHPQFQGHLLKLQNNIALARLDRNVVFSDSISPICLPSIIPGYAPTETSLTIPGIKWANSQIYNITFPRQETTNFDLYEPNGCAAAFKKRKFVMSTTTQGCMSDNACVGSYGAPLIKKFGNKWTAIGILERGCGGLPSLFTRIHPFDDWVRYEITANTTATT